MEKTGQQTRVQLREILRLQFERGSSRIDLKAGDIRDFESPADT